MEVFLNVCITMTILSIVILILVGIVIDFYNLTIGTMNKIYIAQGIFISSTIFLWVAYVLAMVWV